jgi:hypothetical protein
MLAANLREAILNCNIMPDQCVSQIAGACITNASMIVAVIRYSPPCHAITPSGKLVPYKTDWSTTLSRLAGLLQSLGTPQPYYAYSTKSHVVKVGKYYRFGFHGVLAEVDLS